MIQKILSSIILGAGLTACSSYLTTNYSSKTTPVDTEGKKSEWVLDYIKPYKDSLDADMNKVIARAEVDFVVERPSGVLNNWFADAVFANSTRSVKFQYPVMCLFNTGGIRANINKGDVTLGDVFKVMPFDNMLVYVVMPMDVLPEIAAYLKKSGGEPISNAQLSNDGLAIGDGQKSDYFIIITSDYLAAGGDKMTFMQKKVDLTETGFLLRDVLIQEATEQKVLKADFNQRIQF